MTVLGIAIHQIVSHDIIASKGASQYKDVVLPV